MDSKNIVSVAFQLTLFGSLYFRPLVTSYLSLSFSATLRSPVITWPCGSQQNLDFLHWQVYGVEIYSETLKFEKVGAKQNNLLATVPVYLYDTNFREHSRN